MGKYLKLLDTLAAPGLDSQTATKATKASLLSHKTLNTHPASRTLVVTNACRERFIMLSGELAALSPEDIIDFTAGHFTSDVLGVIADMLKIRRMAHNGQVPSHFTATATCYWCGPVFVPPVFANQQINNCPWCLNRRRGTPVPRRFIDCDKSDLSDQISLTH